MFRTRFRSSLTSWLQPRRSLIRCSSLPFRTTAPCASPCPCSASRTCAASSCIRSRRTRRRHRCTASGSSSRAARLPAFAARRSLASSAVRIERRRNECHGWSSSRCRTCSTTRRLRKNPGSTPSERCRIRVRRSSSASMIGAHPSSGCAAWSRLAVSTTTCASRMPDRPLPSCLSARSSRSRSKVSSVSNPNTARIRRIALRATWIASFWSFAAGSASRIARASFTSRSRAARPGASADMNPPVAGRSLKCTHWPAGRRDASR